MPEVELIYDLDCPNVTEARTRLLRAFAAAGVAPRWREWDRVDGSSPPYVARCASPSILVNGVDVDGGSDTAGSACRLYRDAAGRLSGAPSVETVAAALRSAAGGKVRPGRPVWLAGGPALAVAMLPKLACPLCWPAYAALLGALGLGFLAEPRWLLPLSLTAFALLLAVLGTGASRRRGGWVPLALGAAAAAAVLYGKFVVDTDMLVYAGAAALAAACIIKAARPASCCAVPAGGKQQ